MYSCPTHPHVHPPFLASSHTHPPHLTLRLGALPTLLPPSRAHTTPAVAAGGVFPSLSPNYQRGLGVCPPRRRAPVDHSSCHTPHTYSPLTPPPASHPRTMPCNPLGTPCLAVCAACVDTINPQPPGSCNHHCQAIPTTHTQQRPPLGGCACALSARACPCPFSLLLHPRPLLLSVPESLARRTWAGVRHALHACPMGTRHQSAVAAEITGES